MERRHLHAEQRCSAASLVDVLVPPILEEIVKVVKTVLQEQISERIRKQIDDVFVSQIVDQVTEVPKTSNRDRTLQCTAEQIFDVPGPEMAKQLVEVPETVSQERIQQRFVEQIIEAPAISLAEQIVEVPVIQMQGKTQQGANMHVQHVVDTVEVEKPKITELTVQRKKPIIQEKINQVTKHMKIPQAQFLDKANDMLVDVQRQIPVAQTMQKTMEVPLLQFTDKVVDNPVMVQRQISTETVHKSIETPQLQDADKVVDVPVVLVAQVSHVHVVAKTAEKPQLLSDVQAPHAHAVEKTVEIPQLLLVSQIPQAQVVEKTVEGPQSQIVEKTVETPEIQMVRGTETSESLNIAPACQLAQAGTVEAVEIGVIPSTESARPMFVTTPVSETPPVIAENVQLAPGAKYVDLAPAVAYGHAAEDPVTTAVPTVFPTATVPVSMRRPYPVSQVMTQEVVVPVAVPKKLDSPQVQQIDKVVNVPGTAQRQVPSAPRVQKIVEMSKVQFSDGEVDMPVVAQRQVPRIPNVQKTAEVPQIQYIDKIVDASVVERSEDVSVGTQIVSRKRKLSMETESADGTSDSEHGLVQGEECKLVVDETRERHAAGEDPDLLPVAPNMEAGGSHLQATAEEERIVDWTQDLREIRRMVEFLVRRERKLDVKEDVAVRRLPRLEKEHSQQEDEECEASLPDALADRTKVVKLVVDKWFVDKGFGFGRVPTGEVIFIHASVVRGAEVLTIGTDAWVQVVHDHARAQGRIVHAKPGDAPRGKRRETRRGQPRWQSKSDVQRR